MKKLFLALALVLLTWCIVTPSQAMEVSGEFYYLPVAKATTLGVSTTLVSFEREPISLMDKVLNATSLKATVAWETQGGMDEINPDYGGLTVSMNIIKLATQTQGVVITENVGLSVNAGLLVDMRDMFSDPSVLTLEPAIGASLNIRF
jgi:hypothetical protein